MLVLLSQEEFTEVWNQLPLQDRVVVKVPLGFRGVVIPDEATGGVLCFAAPYAHQENPFTFERCLTMAQVRAKDAAMDKRTEGGKG